MPSQIQIETHNSCTRKCWFCKFSQTRGDDQLAVMHPAVFEGIVLELKRIGYDGRISLYGINEPLMDLTLLSRIAALREACPLAFLTLDTNGDLLSQNLIDLLRANGLDAMIINAYDTPALKRLKKFEADPMVVVEDSRKREGRVDNRGGSIRRKPHLFASASMQNRDCARPSTSLQINVRGDVVLCCGDMYGDVVFGNVTATPLMDIWTSEPLQVWRQRLRTKGRKGLDLCQHCSHDGTASFRIPFAVRKRQLKTKLNFLSPGGGHGE